MSLTSSQASIMSIGALTSQDNKSDQRNSKLQDHSLEEPKIVYQTENDDKNTFFRQNVYENNNVSIWNCAQDTPVVYKNRADSEQNVKMPHFTLYSNMHEWSSPSSASSFFSSTSSEHDYDSHLSFSSPPHSRRDSTFINNNNQQQQQQEHKQKPWFNPISKPIKTRMTKSNFKEREDCKKTVGYMNDGYRQSLKTSQFTYPSHYTYFRHENIPIEQDKTNKTQHSIKNSSSNSSNRNSDTTQTRRARNKLASAKYRAKKQALTHAMQDRIMQLATQVVSLRDELSHSKKNEAEIVARYNHLLNQLHQNSKKKQIPSLVGHPINMPI